MMKISLFLVALSIGLAQALDVAGGAAGELSLDGGCVRRNQESGECILRQHYRRRLHTSEACTVTTQCLDATARKVIPCAQAQKDAQDMGSTQKRCYKLNYGITRVSPLPYYYTFKSTGNISNVCTSTPLEDYTGSIGGGRGKFSYNKGEFTITTSFEAGRDGNLGYAQFCQQGSKLELSELENVTVTCTPH